MKFLFRLALLLSCCISKMPAIAQDTLYYDVTWRLTTSDKASYFRTKEKLADGWQVTDRFLTGKPQMTGKYTDDSFHVRQGEFIWYDSSSKVTRRCTYVNNKEDGPETFYYDNGQIQATGNNKDDDYTGEWIGYYPSGKVSGKAKYKNGKQVSGAFYNEDGSRNKEVKVFMRESEFPGGAAQWLRFLNKTFRYPDSAVTNETQGMVIIGFMVAKDGKLYDLHVERTIDKYLDAEALRVMQQSPAWQPAIMGGIISESYKRQPIVFKLQAE
ncbi:MAG TPA: TonB family protein [Puia sp.]|nr:TonB family protein [Puia sp.]